MHPFSLYQQNSLSSIHFHCGTHLPSIPFPLSFPVLLDRHWHPKENVIQYLALTKVQGPVSWKPRRVFGPVKRNTPAPASSATGSPLNFAFTFSKSGNKSFHSIILISQKGLSLTIELKTILNTAEMICVQSCLTNEWSLKLIMMLCGFSTSSLPHCLHHHYVRDDQLVLDLPGRWKKQQTSFKEKVVSATNNSIYYRFTENHVKYTRTQDSVRLTNGNLFSRKLKVLVFLHLLLWFLVIPWLPLVQQVPITKKKETNRYREEKRRQ